MVTGKCPNCGKGLKLQGDLAGKVLRCKNCRRLLRLTSEAELILDDADSAADAADTPGPVTSSASVNRTSPTLLERVRRPEDQLAWDRFAALYTPLMYYWARRQGLQQQDAADLVQDVFATLVERLPDFEYDRQRSFRNWLRTVTLNKLRERRRRRTPQAAGEALADVPDERGDGADFWDNEYREQLVASALELLRSEFQPATWQAFQEHGVRGRPAPEVADELDLTPGAVRAARARVVTRLRQELQGLLD
jgi:RNA polymerase sigma-70 factor (ECF subfamily)